MLLQAMFFPSEFSALRRAYRTMRRRSNHMYLASLLVAIAGSTALAEQRPQCWDCVQHLAMELPEINPQEDPSYEQGLTPASVLPALFACNLDDDDIPLLQQIIKVFTDALVGGGGAAYVREHLDQMPQISADDRAKLIDGAAKGLDTTLRHLIDHNCRILLRSHFDEGANRAWILRMIQLGRDTDAH